MGLGVVAHAAILVLGRLRHRKARLAAIVVSVADQKATLGRKVYFSLQFQVIVHHGEIEVAHTSNSWSHHTEEQREMAAGMLICCSLPWLNYFPTLTVRDFCLGDGATNSGLGLPTSIDSLLYTNPA